MIANAATTPGRERCRRLVDDGQQAAADPGRQTARRCLGRGVRGRAAAAAARLLAVHEARRAHTGLGQRQPDVAGRLPVAGQRGDDRPGLLVAGGEQEGRRAAVRLGADRVVPGLGVAELVHAVRRDRAAGVLVRVDQRGQCAGRAEDRVEVEPQLRHDLVVRPEAGRVHHDIGDHGPVARRQFHPAADLADRLGTEAGDQLDPAGLDQGAQPDAEGAAGRQLVVGAAAVTPGLTRTAHHPDDLGTGLRELGQVEQRRGRRVAGADDCGTAAREAVPVRAEHVRQRVRDRRGGRGLAARRDARAAEHVRRTPGAGAVDDRAAEQLLAAGQADQVRRVVASRRAQPVEAPAGDRDDVGAVPDPAVELRRLGQRREVVVDEVAARRQRVRVGRVPAGRLEQSPGRRVDVVPPRAEEPDVPPLADRGRRAGAGLQDDEVQAALGQVRRGRQADRPGSDDDDRVAVLGHVVLLLAVRQAGGTCVDDCRIKFHLAS